MTTKSTAASVAAEVGKGANGIQESEDDANTTKLAFEVNTHKNKLSNGDLKMNGDDLEDDDEKMDCDDSGEAGVNGSTHSDQIANGDDEEDDDDDLSSDIGLIEEEDDLEPMAEGVADDARPENESDGDRDTEMAEEGHEETGEDGKDASTSKDHLSVATAEVPSSKPDAEEESAPERSESRTSTHSNISESGDERQKPKEVVEHVVKLVLAQLVNEVVLGGTAYKGAKNLKRRRDMDVDDLIDEIEDGLLQANVKTVDIMRNRHEQIRLKREQRMKLDLRIPAVEPCKGPKSKQGRRKQIVKSKTTKVEEKQETVVLEPDEEEDDERLPGVKLRPAEKLLFNLGADLCNQWLHQRKIKKTMHEAFIDAKKRCSRDFREVFQDKIKNLKEEYVEMTKEFTSFWPQLKQCKYCNFCSESQNVLEHHMRHPHHNSRGAMLCVQCGFTSRDANQFVKHMAFAHEMKGYAEKKPLNFCCPLCFFEDNSEKKYSAHYEKCLILWTKNNKDKMNQDPKPEDMFYYGLEKKSLEYTHLKCEICTFWSDNFRSMKYHLAQYHKVDVANVGDFCIYVQHYMISTQTKFRCRRCRYFVPSRKAMENHILWNHNIRVGPNILQFLTHVWVQPEDLDSLLDHYVRERWGVPTIETFVPDPRPNQNKGPRTSLPNQVKSQAGGTSSSLNAVKNATTVVTPIMQCTPSPNLVAQGISQVLAVNPEGYYFLLNMDAQKNIRSIQPVQISGQLSNLQKTKPIGNAISIPIPANSAAGQQSSSNGAPMPTIHIPQGGGAAIVRPVAPQPQQQKGTVRELLSNQGKLAGDKHFDNSGRQQTTVAALLEQRGQERSTSSPRPSSEHPIVFELPRSFNKATLAGTHQQITFTGAQGQKLCFLLPNDIIQKGSVKFQYDPKSKHVTVVSTAGGETSSPQMAFPVVPSGQKPPPPIILSGGRGGAPIPRMAQGGIPSNPLTAQQGNRQWNRQGSPSGQQRVPVDPQTIIQCYICKGKVMAQDLPLHVKNAHHNQPENVKQQALRARYTTGPNIAPKPSPPVITLDDSPRKPFGNQRSGSQTRGVVGSGSQAGSLRINPTLQAGKGTMNPQARLSQTLSVGSGSNGNADSTGGIYPCKWCPAKFYAKHTQFAHCLKEHYNQIIKEERGSFEKFLQDSQKMTPSSRKSEKGEDGEKKETGPERKSAEEVKADA